MFPDLVATAYSILAIDAAGRLERELATARRHLDELAEPLHGVARSVFLTTAIDAAVSTLRVLRARILEAVDARDIVLDVQESALTARMNIVVRAVYLLHRSEREVPASAFAGRFLTIADVTTHLANEVSRILAQWHEHKAAGPQLDESSRRAIRYTSLDDAELSFQAMGRDADLTRFLRVASESPSELVRLTCLEIAATVGLAVSSSEIASRSAREAALSGAVREAASR